MGGQETGERGGAGAGQTGPTNERCAAPPQNTPTHKRTPMTPSLPPFRPRPLLAGRPRLCERSRGRRLGGRQPPPPDALIARSLTTTSFYFAFFGGTVRMIITKQSQRGAHLQPLLESPFCCYVFLDERGGTCMYVRAQWPPRRCCCCCCCCCCCLSSSSAAAAVQPRRERVQTIGFFHSHPALLFPTIAQPPSAPYECRK